MKLIICCFLLIVIQSGIACESNWTHNLDNCEIKIKNKKIKLPLKPPCTTVMWPENKTQVEVIEGKKIAIITGTATNFEYLNKFWKVTKEDKCTMESIGVQLDESGQPIALSKVKNNGGIICPLTGLDQKFFYDYQP